MGATLDHGGTATLVRPVRPSDASEEAPAPAPTPGRWAGLLRFAGHRWTSVVFVAAVALAARLVALPTAYDIFIDETSYASISRNVASGRGATLYGLPFVLHPPAAFGMWGLALLAAGRHGSLVSTVYYLRVVTAVLGAATCVVTFYLVDAMARRRVAVVAALLVALDPLAISFDSRVMLEAPAQLATVSMILFVVLADRFRHSRLRRRTLLVAAGVTGGAALATKETFGLVVLVTLVLMVVTGWVVTRREALRVTVVAVLVYLVSVGADGASFGIKIWWNAKVVGMLRLIGAHQITGFNAPQTHVSLLSRVLANGQVFAVTYVVLATGVFCALGTIWRLEPWYPKRRLRDPSRRASALVALWTLSAAGYLGYATVFGTIEEQMYYILLLPSIVSVCVWWAGCSAVRTHRWRLVATAVVVAALCVNAAVWASIHLGHDDEYRRLVAWEATHVPVSAVIASTDGTSQFLLTRGVIGQWDTVAGLRKNHVDFVVLSTLLVEQGYGLASPAFVRSVERGGRLVFSADGVSDGSLRVYDVQAITGAPL
jgi:4-amino-4-deoxy-L-arabinose transferase-like glycosyltransferase